MAQELVFTKELTDTDVNFRLSFPKKHLGILPEVEGDPSKPVEFPVLCGDEERPREFRCIKRKNGALKPVIEVGWSGLVKDKKIQTGDELEFYREARDDGAPRYLIKVNRKVKSYRDVMGTTSHFRRIV